MMRKCPLLLMIVICGLMFYAGCGEDDGYVVPLICKACCNEVFEEGDKTDVSEVYAAIQVKSGRYEN